jgi:hypothetical protein
MAEPAVTRRVQQRQVLALLLAIAALVLPISGAVSYLQFVDTEGGPSRWILPFLGGAGVSDLVGPVLLAGALALGVLVMRDGSRRGPVARPVLATVLVVAAVSQGAAFLVTGIDLVASDNYSIPDGLTWQATLWATFARLAIQAVLCGAVIAYGMRWLNPTDRRASS